MKLTIIGCGAMGSALAKNLSKNNLTLVDRDFEATNAFAKQIGAIAAKDLAQGVQNSEAVLIAVKPYHLQDLAKQLAPALKPGTIIISVLAGVRVSDLKKHFQNHPIISIMPNIAVAYGKGIIGIVESPDLTEELRKVVQNLFADAGLLIFLPESKIDALAALGGSAPAFAFHLMESMTDGGVLLGFPARQSLDITIKVFEGAIALLKESKELPQALKWQVTSPGGTTIEGIKVLEQERVHYALMQALQATYLKAQKLI
jgi:pyrroline-5-carboxylate reductase